MFSILQSFTIPQGKGMGGSSLFNGMMFARGSPRDYDNWADMGNTGWDYRSVLPYFKKLENYKGPYEPDSGKLNKYIFSNEIILKSINWNIIQCVICRLIESYLIF